MKSLKSLVALGIAIAVSSTTFAETTNPMTAIKESATNQAVTSAKDSAKSAVTEKTSAVKQSAETKVANAKEAVTSTKNSVKKAAKVNINTADEKTLQTLDGIGEAKAKAIVEYRKQNGKIKNMAELSKVSGIGESTLEKLNGFIRF
ncbi:ComEA family DNA-binding protein [Ursidibacter arcticus]|uniref:ComEA family DNA-binding protein n=1 Tax=Ursidibacter arcticus TaxID=1524965 RepID=UPI0012F724D5|nr:helix-hairpin-helix domain-containing protein [Ursidibacter arcticus]KAE9532474.1 hypothetical protein A1D25_00875 [Ursidibacter arcticus]